MAANVIFEYDEVAGEYGMRTDGLILWSQQERLAVAAQALAEWQDRALALGVSVTQLNLTLLDLPGTPPAQVGMDSAALTGAPLDPPREPE